MYQALQKINLLKINKTPSQFRPLRTPLEQAHNGVGEFGAAKQS